MWASASPVGLEGAPGCWQPGHHLQRPHGEVPTALLPSSSQPAPPGADVLVGEAFGRRARVGRALLSLASGRFMEPLFGGTGPPEAMGCGCGGMTTTVPESRHRESLCSAGLRPICGPGLVLPPPEPSHVDPMDSLLLSRPALTRHPAPLLPRAALAQAGRPCWP